MTPHVLIPVTLPFGAFVDLAVLGGLRMIWAEQFLDNSFTSCLLIPRH